MNMEKKFLSESIRGKKTKEQLLEAGIEVFAKFGPEGITTRHIAKVAGVNIAAIQYYFGSKENYYFAVVKHLVEKLRKAIGHQLSKVSDKLDSLQPKSDNIKNLFIRFLQNLIKVILFNPETKFFASISTREHLNPTHAYEIIYKAVSQIHNTVSKF